MLRVACAAGQILIHEDTLGRLDDVAPERQRSDVTKRSAQGVPSRLAVNQERRIRR